MRGRTTASGKENADLIVRYFAGFRSSLAQKKWIDCEGVPDAARDHCLPPATACRPRGRHGACLRCRVRFSSGPACGDSCARLPMSAGIFAGGL